MLRLRTGLRGRVVQFGLLLVVLALVAGCARPAPQEQAAPTPEPAGPKPGGRVVIGYTEEPNTLDPHKTGAAAAWFIMDKLGGPYIWEDPETGKYVPGVFERWEASADGRTWTLKLRPGVKFHSGRALTAADVKATWDRALDPATKTVAAAGMLGPIENIEVVDELTLKVTHKKPFGPFLYAIAQLGGYTHTIDPDALARHGDNYGRNPSSVGPWKFKEWVTGSSITLVKNPDFNWTAPFFKNQGPPYPDELVVKYIPEDATRMAALEAGEIDIVTVAPTEIDRFKDDPRFEIHSYLAQGVNLSIWFNTTKVPLDDVRVRRAINHAVNRKAIIDAAIEGHGVEAHGPLPPTIWGYWEGVKDIAYKLDVTRANALLDEAGWKMGAGGVREKDGKPLKLTLFIMPLDAWQRAAQVIQAQLKPIGIDVEIQSYEWGTLMQYLSEGRHDMNLMGYGYGDPDIMYLVFHSSQIGSGLNWVHYGNPELDELLEAQRHTPEADKRAKVVADAQKFIVEQALWAPIYTQQVYVAVNKRVKDFRVSPRGYWLLHDMWVDQQ